MAVRGFVDIRLLPKERQKKLRALLDWPKGLYLVIKTESEWGSLFMAVPIIGWFLTLSGLQNHSFGPVGWFWIGVVQVFVTWLCYQLVRGSEVALSGGLGKLILVNPVYLVQVTDFTLDYVPLSGVVDIGGSHEYRSRGGYANTTIKLTWADGTTHVVNLMKHRAAEEVLGTLYLFTGLLPGRSAPAPVDLADEFDLFVDLKSIHNKSLPEVRSKIVLFGIACLLTFPFFIWAWIHSPHPS